MKFLRTIRFDASDDHVFEYAAPSDEWAVPGGFLYAGAEPAELAGKARQAFANGFWSLDSLGHATLVSVAEIGEGELQRLTDRLAGLFRERFGAPDAESALNAAHDEIAFVTELCADLPANTLLAVARAFDDDGTVRESFRRIEPPTGTPHARIWDVVEDDGDGA